MSNKKTIVYAATRNLYKYLPMAIGSALRITPDLNVIVIAEDDYIDTIKHPNITIINFHKMPPWLDPNGPNYNSHWTPLTLSRLCLPKLLEDDLILWMDVDTLVLDDLTPLFNEDMTGKCVAAVMEPGLKHENGIFVHPYINSGVMLMNLKLIRELKLDDKMLEMINTEKLLYPDQDVINTVCQFRIKYLHLKYNFSPSTARDFPSLNTIRTQPIVLHFTFAKLWDHIYVQLWREFYRERLGG